MNLLVVDDEESLLHLLGQHLIRLGQPNLVLTLMNFMCPNLATAKKL